MKKLTCLAIVALNLMIIGRVWAGSIDDLTDGELENILKEAELELEQSQVDSFNAGQKSKRNLGRKFTKE